MFSNAIKEPLQKTFAYKGCKITAQKKLVFSSNFAFVAGFFCIGATNRIRREMLCLLCVGFLDYFQVVYDRKIYFQASNYFLIDLASVLPFQCPK